SDRIAGLVGAKLTVTAGFLLIAGGLAVGSKTGVHSGDAMIGGWMAVVGAGMGLGMATSASAALVELPEERSGIRSAIMQAINKTGAPFGAAVLGSVLSSVYLSHLRTTGLSPDATREARGSVFGGLAVAHDTDSHALLANVQDAFAHGLDQALLISGAVALVGAVAAFLFLPKATTKPELEDPRRARMTAARVS